MIRIFQYFDECTQKSKNDALGISIRSALLMHDCSTVYRTCTVRTVHNIDVHYSIACASTLRSTLYLTLNT